MSIKNKKELAVIKELKAKSKTVYDAKTEMQRMLEEV